MKIFKLIISDKNYCYIEYVIGKTKKEIIYVYGGNGKIEKIEEIKNYKIDVSKLIKTLENNNYSKNDIDIISRLLYKTNIGE